MSVPSTPANASDVCTKCDLSWCLSFTELIWYNSQSLKRKVTIRGKHIIIAPFDLLLVFPPKNSSFHSLLTDSFDLFQISYLRTLLLLFLSCWRMLICCFELFPPLESIQIVLNRILNNQVLCYLHANFLLPIAIEFVERFKAENSAGFGHQWTCWQPFDWLAWGNIFLVSRGFEAIAKRFDFKANPIGCWGNNRFGE